MQLASKLEFVPLQGLAWLLISCQSRAGYRILLTKIINMYELNTIFLLIKTKPRPMDYTPNSTKCIHHGQLHRPLVNQSNVSSLRLTSDFVSKREEQ